MFNRIILLSGPVSSGKSTLAKGLAERLNMHVFKTSQLLQEKVRSDLRTNRKVLQLQGERLDRRTRGRWVLEELEEISRGNNQVDEVIIDSVRINEQINAIREAYGPKVIHVHLTAPLDELEHRYNQRKKLGKERNFLYSEIRENPTEKQVNTLANTADIVIDTNRCTECDVLIRTMSHLNIRSGKGVGFVDVVVGGQYGSEGKGQIAAYLSREYDLLGVNP